MNVIVFQCPKGTFAIRRCPVADQARRRVLFVFAQVSSTKIRGLAAGEDQFPNRDGPRERHHTQVRNSPWVTFFYGVKSTKKLSSAPP